MPGGVALPRHDSATAADNDHHRLQRHARYALHAGRYLDVHQELQSMPRVPRPVAVRRFEVEPLLPGDCPVSTFTDHRGSTTTTGGPQSARPSGRQATRSFDEDERA